MIYDNDQFTTTGHVVVQNDTQIPSKKNLKLWSM